METSDQNMTHIWRYLTWVEGMHDVDVSFHMSPYQKDDSYMEKSVLNVWYDSYMETWLTHGDMTHIWRQDSRMGAWLVYGDMTHIWKRDSHMGAWLIYLDMTHIWNCLTWNLNRSRCVRLLNTHVFFRHMSPSCQISLHIWITFFFRVRCLHICVMSHIFKHLRECENMDSWEYECIAHVASMLTSCEMQCLYMYESCHTFKRVRESRFLRIWIHRLKWNVSTRMCHATHSRECDNVESWEYESVMSHVWPHRVECLHVYASCHTFKVMRGHRV